MILNPTISYGEWEAGKKGWPGSRSYLFLRNERNANGITKFYVARLPEKCSSKDISEALGVFGKIEGVYVARKRDKNGFRFGFASFSGVKEALDLERSMKNVGLAAINSSLTLPDFQRKMG